MRRNAILIVVIGLLIIAGATWAAANEGLSINWWTVDSGGGVLEADVYTLTGTIGQPEGGGSVGNGDYSVSGGFFPGDVPMPIITGAYLPLLIGGD